MRNQPPHSRRLAVTILRDIERRLGFSNRILSHHLERFPQLDPRDRGLITYLVYGVLRHRARLDYLIDACADKPRGLRGEPREILRVFAFELVELRRPLHVAGAEAGKVARELDPSGGLARVMTAVLARLDREHGELERRAAAGKPLDALERRWSIPRWLAGRWLLRLGPERAQERARALAEPPPLDIRVDTTQIEPEQVIKRLQAEHPGASVETVAGQPQCLRVRAARDLFYTPLHEQGLVSIQGLASQQPVIVLRPESGERVLDACAGLGVKTRQIAEQMGRQGQIVAVDTDAARLVDLRANLVRGSSDLESLAVEVIEADLTEAPDLGPPFDAVLLDAPCTGLGNLGRHPELRWRAAFDDIAERASLQRRLLEVAAALVRPGGRLVYAVCSLEPEEGPAHTEFMVAQPHWCLELEQTFTPEDHGTDGFYLAALTRR